MEIKHIYWFSYFSIEEPSVRYRAVYPLKLLKTKHNISSTIIYPGYDFSHLSKFLLAYFSVLFFRKRNSVVVFQKIFTRGFYATALKILLYFRRKNTLYDIDDAEYTRRPADSMHHFMRRCAACSAGSESILDYAGKFNKNAFLLTSPVIDHGFAKTTRGQNLTVGWIGYYGAHRDNLTQLVFPGLRDLGFAVRLILLGVRTDLEEQEIRAYFSGNSHITIDTPRDILWLNEESVYQAIKEFDIGVAPLLDNEFNRGKSAFKLKQCLSCGIPVLGSRVGENKRFIADGINGYFCDTPDEYRERLADIQASPNGSYEQLSINAKLSFQSFSIDHYCSTLVDYYGKAD